MNLLTELAGIPGSSASRGSPVAIIMNEGKSALGNHPAWRDKYSTLVEQMENGRTEKDARVAAMTFKVMENQFNYIEGLKSQFGEATVMNSLGPLAPSIMDIVRIFFPNMIANLVAEIQPISTPNSAVLTVKPRYTNTAAGVNAGDEIFKKPTTGYYASDVVTVSLGTGNGVTTVFAGSFVPTPLRPGTVKIFEGGVAVAADNGDGGFLGARLSAGTVNYATGAVSVTFAAPAPAGSVALTMEFRYDYEENVDNLRGVDIGLNLVPVQARPHPLKLTWSIQAALAAQAQYAINVEATLADLGSQFVKKERDWVVVQRIAQASTPVGDLDFDAAVPGSGTDLTKKQHYQDWGLKLTRAHSYIFNKNARGMVSFVLCGINAGDVIRAQANFTPEPTVVPIGAHKIGVLDGNIDVVLDQSLNPNLYVFGFRGMQLGDAAMIIAEWIPIFVTPTWQSPNLQGQQGLLSMYDILLNNPDYYAKGTLSGYAA